jgi:hypothetical protein
MNSLVVKASDKVKAEAPLEPTYGQFFFPLGMVKKYIAVLRSFPY